MKVAEFFHTFEIKELITQLEERNELNEDSLNNLNGMINKTFWRFFMVFMTFILIFLWHYQAWLWGLVVFPAFLCIVYVYTKVISKELCDRLVYLVTFGECAKGKIVDEQVHRTDLWVPLGRHYWYSFCVNGRKYKDNRLFVSKGFLPPSNWGKGRVPILFDKKNPENNILAMPKFKEKLDLRKVGNSKP